jgi:hypothetical protein
MDQIAIQVSDIATKAAGNSMAVLSNFLILVVLTVVFILISYRSRAGIISLLVAFYVGYAIYLVFPYTKDIVASGGSPVIKAAISVCIYAICCIVPYLFVERLVSGGIGVLSVFPRFGLSFLAATFLMALAYHVFSVNEIYTFPEPMNSLFAPNQYFFWWFLAPLLGLLLLVH